MTAHPDNPALAAFLAEGLGIEVSEHLSDAGWQFTGPLWRWTGGESAISWYFITLPAPLVEPVRLASRGRAGAWGMLKVAVTVGASRWVTSLFYSKNVDSYLLPVKAKTRKAEGLVEGDDVTVRMALT